MLGYQWTADGKYKRYANVWMGGAASSDLRRRRHLLSMSSTAGNVNYKNNWNNWWNVGFFPRRTDVALDPRRSQDGIA